MDKLFDGVPDRISPYLLMSGLNQPVEIAKGIFQLALPNDLEGKIDGVLRFRWLPSAAIEFEGDYTGPYIDLETVSADLIANELGMKAPVLITNVTWGQSPQRLRGVFRSKATGVCDRNFDKLKFCLVNFPAYLGSPVKYEENGQTGLFLGRIDIANSELRCVLDEIVEVKELRRSADREAGFVISHVGELVPLGWTLDPKTAEALIDMLHVFFAFLRGAHSGPVFPIGTSENQKIWELLAAWRISETRDVSNWFPQANPVEMNELFCGFVAKWKDETWREPLTNAINWYVSANSSRLTPETRIIMAQVALELLGWVELVESKRNFSHSDFGSITAAGRIRCLLNHLQISTSIPSQFIELNKLLDGELFDGPAIIAHFRNALVHANKKKRKRMSSVSALQLWEAGELSLQYVELTMLSIFGYQGKYARRAWRGWKGQDEVFVPWNVQKADGEGINP